MRITARIPIVIISFLLVAAFIGPQSVSRVKNPVPLERPVPLLIVSGRASDVFVNIQRIVTANGYRIDRLNTRDGEVYASRVDARERSGGADRIVVWLETGIANRAQVRVYFAYGRFEKFHGGRDLERVYVDADEEDTRVGRLKRALLSAGTVQP